MFNTMRDAQKGSRMSPTVHAYTAAMRAATEGGRWQHALDIWHDMRSAQVAPTGHAYAAVITACAAGSDWQRAVGLFEEMCAGGIRPDVVSCTALISALAAAGQWQRAEGVVRWMLGVGLKPNVRTYTALLTALGNACQWDRAVEMLALMQSDSWGAVTPNAYTYSALLKSLGEHGEWQRAEAVFSNIEQQVAGSASAWSQGSRPVATNHPSSSSSMYNTNANHSSSSTAMHSSSTSSGQLFATGAAWGNGPDLSGGELRGQASDSNIWGWQPATQQGLIQRPASMYGLSSASNLEQFGAAAASHLDRFSSRVSSPQPVTTSSWENHSKYQQQQTQQQQAASNASSSVLPAFSSSGSSSQAEQLPSASDAAVNVVELPASAQSSNWTSPSQLNGLSLQLQQDAASNGSYSLFGSSSSATGYNAGGMSQGLGVYDTQLQTQAQTQLLSSPWSPALLSSELVAQQIAAQLALQSETLATQDFVHTHQPDVVSRPPSALLPGMTHSGHGSSRAVAGHASGGVRQVNEVVCGALMLAYERAGKWQEAVGVLRRARMMGIPPNTVMFNTAISAAGKAGQTAIAEEIFQDASSVHCYDAVSFETMIAAYGMVGNPTKAEATFRAMRFEGHRPRDYAYCGLIAAHSLAGDWQAALNVRTRMRKDNVRLSVHAYNALIAACDRAGQYERALDLIRSMKRDGVDSNGVTAQLMTSIGRKGAASVETQQLTAAALSAAMAAAGTLLIRSGVF